MSISNEQIFEQLRETYERVKQIEQRVAAQNDLGMFEQRIALLEVDASEQTTTRWVSKPFSTLNLQRWILAINFPSNATQAGVSYNILAVTPAGNFVIASPTVSAVSPAGTGDNFFFNNLAAAANTGLGNIFTLQGTFIVQLDTTNAVLTTTNCQVVLIGSSRSIK